MHGTVAFSTQARINPAPPRGINKSTFPAAVISAVASLRSVLEGIPTRSAGSPAFSRPSFNALTIAREERNASFPPRKIHTLPLLIRRAAASDVTFGRLS